MGADDPIQHLVHELVGVVDDLPKGHRLLLTLITIGTPD
jgi:hypothetical protein